MGRTAVVRSFDIGGVGVFRVLDGRIVARSGVEDRFGMLRGAVCDVFSPPRELVGAA
jgi:hypothetical protein